MLSSDLPRRPLRPSYIALSAKLTAYPAHSSTAPCRKGSAPFHQQQDEAGGRERRSWPPPAPWGARDAPRGLQEAGGEQTGRQARLTKRRQRGEEATEQGKQQKAFILWKLLPASSGCF